MLNSGNEDWANEIGDGPDKCRLLLLGADSDDDDKLLLLELLFESIVVFTVVLFSLKLDIKKRF